MSQSATAQYTCQENEDDIVKITGCLFDNQ